MNLEQLYARFASRLADLGFTCDTANQHGPMSSGRIRCSSGRSDISFDSDRGSLAVTMGPSAATTYGYQPWADLLGLDVGAGLDASAQAEFLLAHVPQIEAMIASDPHIGDRLRASNWRFVKEYLGLDPDMPRPGD